MAYNTYLAERVASNLTQHKVVFSEKKMFGGLTFMINNKMCIGIVKDQLMARIGPDKMEEALSKDGCKPMDFTGRPMKGYVFVDADGIDLEEDLNYYINLSLSFNKEITS